MVERREGKEIRMEGSVPDLTSVSSLGCRLSQKGKDINYTQGEKGGTLPGKRDSQKTRDLWCCT